VRKSSNATGLLEFDSTRRRALDVPRRKEMWVIEADPITRPKGFRVQSVKVDKHHRRLHKGEIWRFVQMCLVIFYTKALSGEERHQALLITEVAHCIKPEVDEWVDKFRSRYGAQTSFSLTPKYLAGIMQGTQIKGASFRIDGKVAMLHSSPTDNLTVKAILRRSQ
jgi:hypothetical protein